MKTPLALLGLLLCAMPLSAGNEGRRIVAACERTTAAVTPSGNESDARGREFAIRVTNSSSRTVTMPRSPNFGWRVETQSKNDWKLKAEGGPVRRLSANDPHIVVSGQAENLALVEITPAHGETFVVHLPEAQKELLPNGPFSRYRLVLYWGADEKMARTNPTVLPCGLVAEWVVNVQKLPPPK